MDNYVKRIPPEPTKLILAHINAITDLLECTFVSRSLHDMANLLVRQNRSLDNDDNKPSFEKVFSSLTIILNTISTYLHICHIGFTYRDLVDQSQLFIGTSPLWWKAFSSFIIACLMINLEMYSYNFDGLDSRQLHYGTSTN
ncbi:hypothetical protein BC941DRAFT_417494 [Chlamydoabsidia padenii]|nr:hypothetical protein BC941DRAFT_417494 [Chlamydoabsidia padenii]